MPSFVFSRPGFNSLVESSSLVSTDAKRAQLYWVNVKILKSESYAYRRRVAESFLINRKACSCNVINRNDGANFPTVYIYY